VLSTAAPTPALSGMPAVPRDGLVRPPVPGQMDPFAAPFLGDERVFVERRRLDEVDVAVPERSQMQRVGAPSRASSMGRWFGCLVRSG
jgi:hypothetical protein